MQDLFIGGINMVQAFLLRSSGLALVLYYAKGGEKKLEQVLPDKPLLHCRTQAVDVNQLNDMFGGISHQGVVLHIKNFPTMSLDALADQIVKQASYHRVLVLDQVQDPQNLGACFRSAAAFGVTAIIIPDRNAVGITPVVSKVSCGACALVPLIKVKNLVRAMRQLKQAGLWFYGTSEFAGNSLSSMVVDRSIAWVMGGEDKGVRSLVMERCDSQFFIPVDPGFTTLNVATATGIVLYHTFVSGSD